MDLPIHLWRVGCFVSPSPVLHIKDRLTVYRGPGKTTLCRAVAGCINPDCNRLGSYGNLSSGMVSVGHTMGTVRVGDVTWTFYSNSGDVRAPKDVRFGETPFDTVLGYGVERTIGNELHDFGYGQRSDFAPLFSNPDLWQRARLTSTNVWMIREELITHDVSKPRYDQLKTALCILLGADQIRVGNFEMNFHFGNQIRSTRQLTDSQKRIVGLMVDIAQKVDHFNPTKGLCIIDGHNVGLSTEKAHQVLDEAMVLWPELSFLVTEY